ncbi:hypothetical protein [Gloeocapsa sp. PCC 73106]|uniref:hypothetical protein n=1 Tax=Gloeocapsa sp. PCC 73106 TaxID=102232 RepID=UPI0002AC95DA|nr:hypothetical protein [Gloeocapsa sp. PCC 73106]ELR98601.1 hypothetical protein GLO73106DRAFT_00024380 [Gloeocapsa sp. PCC 73106]
MMILHIFPFLLLAMAVGSAVLDQRTNHDIYGVLTVVSLVVCLIWGLVVSHWLINLLALVIVLKVGSNLRLKIN